MVKKQAKQVEKVSEPISEPKQALEAESEPQKAILVECVFPFLDNEANITRTAGDRWEITDERLRQIMKVSDQINMPLIKVL